MMIFVWETYHFLFKRSSRGEEGVTPRGRQRTKLPSFLWRDSIPIFISFLLLLCKNLSLRPNSILQKVKRETESDLQTFGMLLTLSHFGEEAAVSFDSNNEMNNEKFSLSLSLKQKVKNPILSSDTSIIMFYWERALCSLLFPSRSLSEQLEFDMNYDYPFILYYHLVLLLSFLLFLLLHQKIIAILTNLQMHSDWNAVLFLWKTTHSCC